jgi:hypothetical protein
MVFQPVMRSFFLEQNPEISTAARFCDHKAPGNTKRSGVLEAGSQEIDLRKRGCAGDATIYMSEMSGSLAGEL